MGKSIGIDLGTTNSVMSIRVLKSDIILNAEGEELTPSVVSYGKSGIVVGRKAQDLLLQDPENTIRSVKRLMGRSHLDPEVQLLTQSSGLGFSLGPLSQGAETSLAIKLKNGTEVTPVEVSSEILKKIKRDAELFLKDEVTEAVITVPAYFNEKQKHATHQAAELAGFKVSRLLSESSAAAIAYGIDQSPQPQTVMVYDFGGGTLDISVLSYAGGHFMEQAKGGDMWLGGDDIDKIFYEFIVQKIEEEFALPPFATFLQSLPVGDRLRLRGEILRAAEKAKILLSNQHLALVEINSSVKSPGGTRIQTDLEISRSQFEELIKSIVLKSELLTNQVLNSIHFTPEMVNQVLMVGGSSAIPAFQNSMIKMFGADKVKVHARPMLTIAEGAAILAKKMTGLETEQGSGLGQVMYRSAHDYYLRLANGQQMLLVSKQSPLPVTIKKILKYEHASQLLGHFCFSNKSEERFEPIGDLWLSHLPKEIGYDPSLKAPEIDFSFTVTEDELVKVEVSLIGNPEISLSKTISRSEEDEKLFEILNSSIEEFNHKFKKDVDAEEAENRVFNFLYYSASLGRLITKEVSEQKIGPQTNRADHLDRVAQLNQKITLAKEICLMDPSDNKRGHHWNRYLFLQALSKYYSQYFEKADLLEFRKLVNLVFEEIGSLSGLENIEKALNNCLEFAKARAPQALAMTHLEGDEPAIEGSYHSYVHTQLSEK
jgi:molecular chaperone DnaK